MSCIAVDGGRADVCANCGKGSEGGAVKLKDCTACRLVKHCGVDCQRPHRKQHKKACKQRAAELKDEQLYSQGLEKHEGNHSGDSVFNGWSFDIQRMLHEKSLQWLQFGCPEKRHARLSILQNTLSRQ